MNSFFLPSVALISFVSLLLQAATSSRALSQGGVEELYPGQPILEITKIPEAALDSVQRDFLKSFTTLIAILHRQGLNLDPWFREDHVGYFNDYMTRDEKIEMIRIMNELAQRARRGEKNLNRMLIGAGSAFVIAKAGKLDREVLRVKDQHKDVIRFAIAKHEVEFNQTYGEYPYSYHLRKVRSVLKRFGFGPKESILGLNLGTAAWLHDLIEDTNVTYEQVHELFGKEVADIVRGVTKLPKVDGVTSEMRLRQTYEFTRLIKGSRILKVADRIANVEEGLLDLFSGRPTKVFKYFDEWPLFKEILYVPGEADAMWMHLERLLNDYNYARVFVLKESRVRSQPKLCKALFKSSI